VKTLLITGGNGLLGQHLIACAQEQYRIFATDLSDLPYFNPALAGYSAADLTNERAVSALFERLRPDAVIHTAAMTDVDGCEQKQALARKINVNATAFIASACHRLGTQLVHLSTDYVFDGASGPYAEEDKPRPISYYGETKLESEYVVQNRCPDAAIARTMVLFGQAAQVRPNFVTWLIQRLGQEMSVRIVNDQYGNPTWAGDLAEMILALIRTEASGVFHTVGPEWVHRYALAQKVAEVFDLNASLITETDSTAFQQTAARPLKSGLKIDKMMAQTGIAPRSLTAALTAMKNKMSL